MKVFKFGGASVNSVDAVRNLGTIIKRYPDEKLMVVISAMGKTTNALEEVLNAYFNRTSDPKELFKKIKGFHNTIISHLFPENNESVFARVEQFYQQLDNKLKTPSSDSYDYEYDQIVSYGELISTTIVSEFLNAVEVENQWVDARNLIITDYNYREAGINWEKTKEQVNQKAKEVFGKCSILVTQGFIGASPEKYITTLGREGSDYTAAILGWCVDASEVVIWKDVPGLLNADPKYFSEAEIISQISYHEAIELAYYGASIIHPKTLQPLQNKNIPLIIKSFINPGFKGSFIGDVLQPVTIPSYIFKKNQVLISLQSRDFSFINEKNLSFIFETFFHHSTKINLMQNSAISFSVCVENNQNKLPKLISELNNNYKVKYNENLELITIRNYSTEIIDKIVQHRKIILEQKSRVTVQLLVADTNKSL
ncbi:MAG: aspartate kinase [Bacteroidota bacterium]